MSTRATATTPAYSVAKTGLMRLTEALDLSLQGSGVQAFDVAPGVVDTPMTRSMAMWRGFNDWTPPERVVELVAAIAAGELDAWSGRFLRAGKDDLDALRATDPATGSPASSASSPTGPTTRWAERSEDRGQRSRRDVHGDRRVRVELHQLAVQLQRHGRERGEGVVGGRRLRAQPPRRRPERGRQDPQFSGAPLGDHLEPAVVGTAVLAERRVLGHLGDVGEHQAVDACAVDRSPA